MISCLTRECICTCSCTCTECRLQPTLTFIPMIILHMKCSMALTDRGNLRTGTREPCEPNQQRQRKKRNSERGYEKMALQVSMSSHAVPCFHPFYLSVAGHSMIKYVTEQQVKKTVQLYSNKIAKRDELKRITGKEI